MKATALFLAASALAAVSAGAYDGYGYDPRPASSYNNTISGAAHIGYDSRYAYKDVVASSVLNRSGVFNIGGELNLNLVRDWKQEIGAEYMAFCDGLLSDKDAFDASWKASRAVRQSFLRGGWLELRRTPGYLSFFMESSPFPYSPSRASWRMTIGPAILIPECAVWLLRHDRLAHYCASKRWCGLIHEKVDLELSAGTGYSSSYWGPGISQFV